MLRLAGTGYWRITGECIGQHAQDAAISVLGCWKNLLYPRREGGPRSPRVRASSSCALRAVAAGSIATSTRSIISVGVAATVNVASGGTAAAAGYIGHGAAANLGFEFCASRIQCIIAQWCAPWLRQHAGRFASESAFSANIAGARPGANNATSSVIDSTRRMA